MSIWEVDSPVGRLGLAGTGEGLLRLSYLRAGDEEAAGLEAFVTDLMADSASLKVERLTVEPEPFVEIRRQLSDYFHGRLRRFTTPIDWRGSRGFHLEVRKAVFNIPYGQVRSYKEVAVSVGSEDAARAVGQAMAKNPLALVVPCHRVVNSDGSRGGYGGGTQAKDFLLDLESGALNLENDADK